MFDYVFIEYTESRIKATLIQNGLVSSETVKLVNEPGWATDKVETLNHLSAHYTSVNQLLTGDGDNSLILATPQGDTTPSPTSWAASLDMLASLAASYPLVATQETVDQLVAATRQYAPGYGYRTPTEGAIPVLALPQWLTETTSPINQAIHDIFSGVPAQKRGHASRSDEPARGVAAYHNARAESLRTHEPSPIQVAWQARSLWYFGVAVYWHWDTEWPFLPPEIGIVNDHRATATQFVTFLNKNSLHIINEPNPSDLAELLDGSIDDLPANTTVGLVGWFSQIINLPEWAGANNITFTNGPNPNCYLVGTPTNPGQPHVTSSTTKPCYKYPRTTYLQPAWSTQNLNPEQSTEANSVTPYMVLSSETVQKLTQAVTTGDIAVTKPSDREIQLKKQVKQNDTAIAATVTIAFTVTLIATFAIIQAVALVVLLPVLTLCALGFISSVIGYNLAVKSRTRAIAQLCGLSPGVNDRALNLRDETEHIPLRDALKSIKDSQLNYR